MGFITQSHSWGQAWPFYHLGSATTICSFRISLRNSLVRGDQAGKAREKIWNQKSKDRLIMSYGYRQARRQFGERGQAGIQPGGLESLVDRRLESQQRVTVSRRLAFACPESERPRKSLHSLGTWVAQSVQCPTFDFGSDHDLTVCEFKLCIGLCADRVEPCLGFSLSLSTPPVFVLSLFLQQNKTKQNKII